MSLDASDAKLVAELQKDGRATIRSLSEIVGLPESTTRDRIRNLEERGVLEGYHAKVDPDKLGVHIVAWVFIDTDPETANEFAEFADLQPAVVRGHAAGRKVGAFTLKVAARNSQELTKTLQQWSQRFNIRIRDLLLVDDVRPREAVVNVKGEDTATLSALRQKA